MLCIILAAGVLLAAISWAGADSLTAAGQSSTVLTKGVQKVAFWVKLATVGTAATLQFQGKINTSDWFSIMPGDSLRWVANHDTLFVYTTAAVLDSVRVKFLSEGDSTTAVFTIQSRKAY